MRGRIWTSVVVAALFFWTHGDAQAQVVEEREGESNPGGIIFKSTLYGLGTGLVIGGAYALIEDDEDVETEDCLKWGAAIGAVGGLAVGLVYAATRSEPKGDVEAVDVDEFRMSLSPGLTFDRHNFRPGDERPPLKIRLLSAKF